MKQIKDFVKGKAKKHGKKFSLFLIIGVFKTLISISLNWLFIDIMHLWALFGSTLATAIVFFITYYTYIAAKVIKPSFLKYTSTTISFNIITIGLIWVLVDFAGFSGALSSTIVIGSLFILRYLFFNKIGLIHHG